MQLDGRVATLILDVEEDGGIVPGYELKLNSYDLGVDIELYDAVQRLRFEHPEVGAVVITSGKQNVFSAGANIKMLAQAGTGWKINFCKFTNETRNSMEDASAHSGQRYLAALNGTASGGGYELALACEHIVLVDDNRSAVSLPETPLLGVLPGTGGLTRVVDKRGVRRDLADVLATTAEGIRGRTALDWGLVDELSSRSRLPQTVRTRAQAMAADSDRPPGPGIRLRSLERHVADDEIHYRNVSAVVDRDRWRVDITVRGPSEGSEQPGTLDDWIAAGDQSWALAAVRELDDLILHLRTNEPDIGTWVLRTAGSPGALQAVDEAMASHANHWLLREIILYWKRTLKRLDVTSRSLIALIEPESCFAGTLFELALAADRSYMLEAEGSTIRLTSMNFGHYPMANGLSRLATRFLSEPGRVDALAGELSQALNAGGAAKRGLVTFIPDEIDWADEVRLALEERSAFSPDALTGMEANLRFPGPETMETKIFGRLSAWQNWIFQRPNAVGPEGALPVYGTGRHPVFDRKRA